MVAWTETEQIIELQTTLNYLEVPFKYASQLFGDNMTVVDNNTNPAFELNKWHVPLS